MDVIKEIKKLDGFECIDRCNRWLEENKNDNTNLATAIMLLKRCEMELILYQRSLGWVVKENFPVLTNTAVYLPHCPENHRHVEVFPVSLDQVRAEVMKAVPDNFWEASFVERGRNVDTMMTVFIMVDNLLTSVLEGMNLDDFVDISYQKCLAGVDCDLLLVEKRNRLPFAVININEPGNCSAAAKLVFEGKEEEKGGGLQNRLAGQVYGQMTALRLFGFPTVTGMISTGNQWRIVGLRNGEDGIAGDVGQKVVSYLSQTDRLDTSLPVSFSGEKVPCCDKKTEESNARLEIWGSDIVPSHEGLESKSTKALKKRVEKSGEEIVSLLVLFLYKAFSNLTDLLTRGIEPMGPSLQEGPMPCRILVNDDSKGNDDGKRRKSDVFTFGTVTLTQLELGTFNPKLTKIHVCRHLGMGDNANVCLGTSEDGGSCCAVKFYHRASSRDLFALSECQNWTKVYGSQTHFAMPYTLEVAGGHCLVMPYLYPIQPEERLELLDNGEIRRALETFAASGFIHVDMKWRHIRMWRGKEDSRIFIIDLGNGSLERRKKKVDIDKWIKKSINDLRDSGPLPCLEAQANIGKRKRKR